MKNIFIILLLSIFLFGCASTPESLKPCYGHQSGGPKEFDEKLRPQIGTWEIVTYKINGVNSLNILKDNLCTSIYYNYQKTECSLLTFSYFKGFQDSCLYTTRLNWYYRNDSITYFGTSGKAQLSYNGTVVCDKNYYNYYVDSYYLLDTGYSDCKWKYIRTDSTYLLKKTINNNNYEIFFKKAL